MRFYRYVLYYPVPHKRPDLPFPIHGPLANGNALNERALLGVFHMNIRDVPLHGIISLRVRNLGSSVSVARIPVSPKRRRIHGRDQSGGVAPRVADRKSVV